MTASDAGQSPVDIAAELSAFQEAILTVLAAEARPGVGVGYEVETYLNKEGKNGWLYTNLDELVDLNLIERGELDGRTNEYSITESGYDVLYAKFAWQAEQIGTDEQHAEELRTVVAEATEKGQ